MKLISITLIIHLRLFTIIITCKSSESYTKKRWSSKAQVLREAWFAMLEPVTGISGADASGNLNARFLKNRIQNTNAGKKMDSLFVSSPVRVMDNLFPQNGETNGNSNVNEVFGSNVNLKDVFMSLHARFLIFLILLLLDVRNKNVWLLSVPIGR